MRSHFTVFGCVLASAFLFSGCRFGNQTKVTTQGYDTASGYYATEPVRFEIEAQFSDRSGIPARTTAFPVAMIPAYYRRSLTNPVVLMVQSVKTGAAYLVSKDDTNYYQPTTVDQDALTFGLSETQALEHYGCRVDLTVADVGAFDKDRPSVVNGINVRGRLRIERNFEVRFSGVEANCQELRELFHLCLTDQGACPNEVHVANAKILYQSFLDAGGITAEEIKTLRYLRHTTKHQ